MTEVIYKLEHPIEGVEELALFAPTRKHLKMAAVIRQAHMRTGLKLSKQEGISDDDKQKAKEAKAGREAKATSLTEEEKVEESAQRGEEIYIVLLLSEEDIMGVQERFVKACINSPMCLMNGGHVSEEFFDQLRESDIIGMFKTFLGNFIII